MTRGGVRPGAGRPVGQGKYKEPTKPIRLPVSMIDDVMKFVESRGYNFPLYGCAVQAGYPDVADDYVEKKVDLNELLVDNPSSTFLVRAVGESMINAGIYPGDILVVDRKIEAKHGKVVVAAIDGQLTVKRLCNNNQELFLMPENNDFKPIKIEKENNIFIWGVVTSVIHKI